MKKLHPKAAYEQAFSAARAATYPEIDALEKSLGVAIDRGWLEGAAFVLNCPVKVNPPNWQHGRVIYAALSSLLRERRLSDDAPVAMVDIGTAKGFSACVIALALKDAGEAWASCTVHTVDVIDPEARVPRNTVAEIDGLKTLTEIMEPYVPDGINVMASGGGSMSLLDRLSRAGTRVPFAFVDGKHSYNAVISEGAAVAAMQRAGDMIVFDDCQIPEVARAVNSLSRVYDCDVLDIGPRVYTMARRR